MLSYAFVFKKNFFDNYPKKSFNDLIHDDAPDGDDGGYHDDDDHGDDACQYLHTKGCEYH